MFLVNLILGHRLLGVVCHCLFHNQAALEGVISFLVFALSPAAWAFTYKRLDCSLLACDREATVHLGACPHHRLGCSGFPLSLHSGP